MSTDNAPANKAPLNTGGTVAAIVPQTFEEITRVAVTIINAGIAPAALVQTVPADAPEDQVLAAGKRNVAAVATCIMAGAELGLPPMVSLRAFTVINGRPALYADGNIAVIRKAKDADGKPICEYIRQGFEVGDSEETTFAWVEAKRRDNGEMHREEFSIFDARLAGLWDDAPTRRGKIWRDKPGGGRESVWGDVPNDSVWHRYPRRMMMWRAAGYCLRWLFADVLGGIQDEHEAREIEGMVDITPSVPVQRERPQPPPVPEDDGDEVIGTTEHHNAPVEPEKPKDPPPPKPSRARPKKEAAPTPPAASPEPEKIIDPAEAAPPADTTVVENTATGEPMTVDGDGVVIEEEEEPDPAPPPTVQQAIAEVEAEGDPGTPEAGSPAWWDSLEQWARLAGDKDALDEVFGSGDDGFDVYASLAGDEQATNDATELYNREIARITEAEERKQLEASGQSTFLDDLPEETKAAVRNANTP